jgi:DNA topoisomerase VI subunit B
MVAGSQWMSANLSLTGFNGDNCGFMTCKELIENGLDAVADESHAVIKLEVEGKDAHLMISCEDNGRGFEVDSVDSLCTVFSSSKAMGSRVSTGKFGVGLKAMTMMSSGTCKTDVVITSAIRGSRTAVVFRLKSTSIGEIVMSEPVLIERTSEDWTTRVSVCSPAPSNLEDFLEGLTAYMRELCMVRQKTACELILCGNSIFKFPNKDEEIPESVSHQDASGLVRCTACLTFEQPSQDTARIVRIIRFVNGVPLITPNSSGCNMLQGAVGTVLKQSASLGIDLVAASGPLGKDMVCYDMAVSSGPPDSAWTRLLIRINLSQAAANVEYNCLSKDAVVGVKNTSASLPVVVGRCVRACLKKAQMKFRSEFQSHEDFEFKCALKKHIPCIAHNLSALCSRLSSFSAKEKLCLSTNHMGEIENKISAALIHALGDRTAH